ncbi:hemin uptake protein HemP [Flexibacterium corallicola]|uniref:hemin uptake protein HemP n=1 Tax=Flexibacterium corallicola TaxID=3037259 RepID=UPI00286EB5F2|nr:hemin uptake protein HemP [Pseudovibrio sp. M1P-2-3]
MPTKTSSSQSSEFTKKTLDSVTLFNGDKEVQISHNDETYKLTITKLGKLILTK